jgi:hypothetical protein
VRATPPKRQRDLFTIRSGVFRGKRIHTQHAYYIIFILLYYLYYIFYYIYIIYIIYILRTLSWLSFVSPHTTPSSAAMAMKHYGWKDQHHTHLPSPTMTEDCHALISKVTKSGRRVPQEVRNHIADFVNGHPDFNALPTGLSDSLMDTLRTIWPTVRRFELTRFHDLMVNYDFHRITVFLRVEEASLRLIMPLRIQVHTTWASRNPDRMIDEGRPKDHSVEVDSNLWRMTEDEMKRILRRKSRRYPRIVWSYARSDHVRTPDVSDSDSDDALEG